MKTVRPNVLRTRPFLICNRGPACLLLGRAQTRPPSSDVAVFSGGEYDLNSVKEAKRSYNLFSVSSRQANDILRVQRPCLAGAFLHFVKLKELFAIKPGSMLVSC